MKNRSIVYQIIIAVLGAVIGVCAVLTVQAIGNNNNRKVKAEYGEWRKLNLILQSIDANYVDTVDTKALTDAAVDAVLKKLDPHSIYMPPQDLEASEEDLAGNFSGIGIQFNVPNDTAIVIESIAGGPAQKVGMLAGDRIIKVDDKVIAGVKFPQDSMVRRMKGPTGTKVTVTVLREGELIPFEITRDRIPTHSVTAAFMVNDTTAYLRLSKFARTTASEFCKAALDLQAKGMKELIVDLRENTGGYFDQALSIADQFLPKGADIVYTEGLHRRREIYQASGKGFLKDISLKVLIDDASASSSEILAGAIQDNDRGTLYGRRSFGKGLVQEPLFFTDGSGIRITVARFHTPSGRCIQKPYSDDYEYDLYKRYEGGEMLSADSIKVDTTKAYFTKGGRKVYGGGGIIPDVFVPVDTTKVSPFYVACNRKATAMRYSSYFFDHHKDELQGLTEFDDLQRYLESKDLEADFLSYAKQYDGLVPDKGWSKERNYMMTVIEGLIGRYTPLGDDAYYHLVLGSDTVYKAALK